MAWIFDESLPIVFVGILFEAVLLSLFVQTGRRSIMVAMIIVSIFFGGLLVAEWMIVTDTESVEGTLNSISRDLEENDPVRMAGHLSVMAPELKRKVESELGQVVIRRATIKGKPKITIHDVGYGQTATADFKGLIVGSDRRGAFQDFHYLRRFMLHFRRENDKWKLYEYEERPPL